MIRELNQVDKKTLSEFVRFVKQIGIPRARIIHKLQWYDVIGNKVEKSTSSLRWRAEMVERLRQTMKRFRAGQYIVNAKGNIEFKNPPWKPLCPIEQLWCNGAILPGDCPKGHRECAYNKNDWKIILELRGEKNVDTGENSRGNSDRSKHRRLIQPRPRIPIHPHPTHAPGNIRHATAIEDRRPKAPTG